MANQKFLLLIVSIVIASFLFWGYMFYDSGEPGATQYEGELTDITMYRTAGCECCVKWADHLEENGFRVETKTVNNLLELKSENGVPGELASCHTAFVDEYIIEGHVPAEDVRRLITEKPDAAGITVPGMPIGSPGMEGSFVQNYEVILFDKNGKEEVFARH
ncbi:MAG: DUF411 domain-containing protein [Balneolaceae bacterium]